MKISKDKILNYIPINSPRWKQRTIGIATYRVKEENEIDVLAVSKKDGQRYFPFSYYATREQIVKYPKQTLPSGTVLYLVPMAELDIIERI